MIAIDNAIAPILDMLRQIKHYYLHWENQLSVDARSFVSKEKSSAWGEQLFNKISHKIAECQQNHEKKTILQCYAIHSILL